MLNPPWVVGSYLSAFPEAFETCITRHDEGSFS
jgi:hypothetical protein